MQIEMPAYVEFILEVLEANNHEGYIVGGCVRDSILGRKPKDWDITTSATPDKVIEMFEDSLAVKAVIPTGIDFGTVTVVSTSGESYEITTFRGDIYTPDTGISHKPKWVDYVDDIVQDLSRRDFTMNAIAYNKKKGIVDPFGGIEDIKEESIKCVGNPMTRFKEDPLRMLRAIRFAAQIGFYPTSETSRFIIQNAKLINNISAERIQAELNKILLCNPTELRSAPSAFLLEHIMPELLLLREINQNNPWHSYNAFNHSLKACEIIEPCIELRLAALLHDLGKFDTLTTDENGIDHFYGHGDKSTDKATDILKRLKYSNETIDKVTSLIQFHDYRLEATEKSIKRLLNTKLSEEYIYDWLKLRYADVLAQNLEAAKSKPRLKKLFLLEELITKILTEKQPYSRKDLVINGHDLLKIGFKPIDLTGVFNKLVNIVIDDSNMNNQQSLTESAKRIYEDMYT